MKTVAVIGGGIAGLSVAEAVDELARERGVAVRARVLEAGPRAGGKIGTVEREGFTIELGPHGFLDKEPAVTAQLARLGLTERLLRADPAAERRYVVRKGALVELPSSPPRFLGSPVLPLLGRLRAMLEPFIRRRRGGEESVWSFAARRLGRWAADVLVDAMVTGIYGGDPRRLSVDAAFPLLVSLEREHGSLVRAQLARRHKGVGPRGALMSFDRGLSVWIDALAARVELETGAAVEALEREGARWILRVRDRAAVHADAVVITTPADVTARLLGPHDAAAARALEAIPYAPVAVVVQGFEARSAPRVLGGFGFLAPELEGREVLGSIFASSVFRGHARDGAVMLRTLLGGGRHPERADGDDAALLARARRELAALVGLDAQASPLVEHVVRWPRAIPQYELGHLERVAAVEAATARMPGLLVGGNAMRGVAMVQCVADGRRLAERSLDLLAS